MAHSSNRKHYCNDQLDSVIHRDWKWFIEVLSYKLKKVGSKVKFKCNKYVEPVIPRGVIPEINLLDVDDDQLEVMREYVHNEYREKYNTIDGAEFGCFGEYDAGDETYCKWCPHKIRCSLKKTQDDLDNSNDKHEEFSVSSSSEECDIITEELDEEIHTLKAALQDELNANLQKEQNKNDEDYAMGLLRQSITNDKLLKTKIVFLREGKEITLTISKRDVK